MITRENNDFFSSIPKEIAAEIMSHLSIIDIKKMNLVSKFFHHVVSEYFLNSLSYDAFCFGRWQENEIAQLKANAQRFIEAHQIGFLNRPHENLQQGLEYYKKLLTPVALMGFAAFNFMYTQNTQLDANHDNLLPYMKGLVCALFAALVVVFYMNGREMNMLDNLVHQHSNITDVHRKFFLDNARLFANDLNIEHILRNPTLLRDALEVLDKSIETIEANAQEIKNYFSEQMRSTIRRDMDERDIELMQRRDASPNFTKYCDNVFGHWFREVRDTNHSKKEERRQRLHK